MQVQVGISNHHIHLTQEDYEILFGDTLIIKEKQLQQPGEYASNLTATLQTKKGSIENVRVLLPFRSYTQVELSKTDAYKLGIDPPIRDSGDLQGASEITIVGTKASISKKCVIIATRHIHMNPNDQNKLGLQNKKEVQVTVKGPKGGVLDHVKLKVGPNYKLELHLDTDDANGMFLKTGDYVDIL